MLKTSCTLDKEKDGLHIWSSVMGLKPKVTFILIWKSKTNCPVSFLSKCLYLFSVSKQSISVLSCGWLRMEMDCNFKKLGQRFQAVSIVACVLQKST